MFGGLVGQGWSGTQYWILTNCAFYGNVTGAEGNTGALVGYSSTDGGASKVAINNCYYPDGLSAVGGFAKTIGTNDSHAKTAERFASGQVAYLLNGESADGVWKQTIYTGLYPNFTGRAVFFNEDTETYYNEAGFPGDLDLDGDVDSDDLTMLARHVGGIITDWDQE